MRKTFFLFADFVHCLCIVKVEYECTGGKETEKMRNTITAVLSAIVYAIIELCERRDQVRR